MKSIWHIASLVFFLLIDPACDVQPITPADTAAGSDAAAAGWAVTPSSPQEAAPSSDLSASNRGEDNAAALIWEGQPLGDSPHGNCVSLRIDADSRAFVGSCGEANTPVEFFAGQPGGWAEIVARFAPFEQETTEGRIVFRGQGQVSSPAWQRAITTWARFTYAELASGRVSASGHTVLSWWLGNVSEQPGLCRQLVVLSHGYAYANITPCEGGQVQETVGGWLETGEWDQFDSWLYDRAPLYQDNNYFSGQNSTEMSQAEAAALADWASRVYERLAPASVSYSQPD